MNEFGRMADDLTYMGELLDSPDLAPYAAALKRALDRAFVEACKAGRAMRLAEEPPAAKPARRRAGALRPATL